MGYPWSLFYISKLLDKPSLSFEKSFQKLVPSIKNKGHNSVDSIMDFIKIGFRMISL